MSETGIGRQGPFEWAFTTSISAVWLANLVQS